MTTREVLIIGGAARSGTTLAVNLFAGHPGVQVIPTECVGFGTWGDVPRITGIRSPSTHEQMELLLERALAKTPLRHWNVDLDTAKGLAREIPPGWHGLFVVMVEARHARDPERPIVVKTPWAEKHFLAVKPLLEERGWRPRLLYVIRDPVDVYRSFRHRSFAWTGRSAHRHTDTLAWCTRWLSSTGHAMELREMFPQLMRVACFEDFVRDPSGQCREWCRWLGLDDQAARMVALDGRRANSSFDLRAVAPKEGGVLDLESREKEGLSDAEQDLVRRVCGTRAKVFGYDLGPMVAPGAQPEHFEQHLSLSELAASEYPGFLGRDMIRRLKRIAMTLYSMATRKETSLQLR